MYGLTREMVPTELLTHPVVWEALLERMPLTRADSQSRRDEQGRAARAGSGRDAHGCRRGWRDAKRCVGARVHPLAVLAALKTYAQGRGMKGQGHWTPVPQVVDALDGAFYLSFENARVDGQAHHARARRVGLDGRAGAAACRISSCREASAAMALVTAATEPHHRFVAFTNGEYPSHVAGCSAAGSRRWRSRRASGWMTWCAHRQPAVRRHGLRAADGGGAEASLGGGRVRRLHRQRDVGRRHPPGAGAARSIASAWGSRRSWWWSR